MLSYTLNTVFYVSGDTHGRGLSPSGGSFVGNMWADFLWFMCCAVKERPKEKEREKGHNRKLMKWSTKHEKVF